MRLVSRRRTGSTVPRLTKIRHALHAELRSAWAIRLSRIGGERRNIGRNIEDDPVPPAAAGRSIGVIHRHRKAFGTLRGIGPAQFGGHIVAAASESIEDMRLADGALVLDGRAGELKIGR